MFIDTTGPAALTERNKEASLKFLKEYEIQRMKEGKDVKTFIRETNPIYPDIDDGSDLD